VVGHTEVVVGHIEVVVGQQHWEVVVVVVVVGQVVVDVVGQQFVVVVGQHVSSSPVVVVAELPQCEAKVELIKRKNTTVSLVFITSFLIIL
jgi:hypothetical protein